MRLRHNGKNGCMIKKDRRLEGEFEMLDDLLRLLEKLTFIKIQATPQVQVLFAVFGSVCIIIGYWIKQITGAILGTLLVFLLYLYMTGFF